MLMDRRTKTQIDFDFKKLLKSMIKTAIKRFFEQLNAILISSIDSIFQLIKRQLL